MRKLKATIWSRASLAALLDRGGRGRTMRMRMLGRRARAPGLWTSEWTNHDRQSNISILTTITITITTLSNARYPSYSRPGCLSTHTRYPPFFSSSSFHWEVLPSRFKKGFSLILPYTSSFVVFLSQRWVIALSFIICYTQPIPMHVFCHQTLPQFSRPLSPFIHLRSGPFIHFSKSAALVMMQNSRDSQ